MSWFYDYYLGYEKDGKIYPLGPYDSHGKLHRVLSKSRSFASHLYKQFVEMSDDEASEELKKQFTYQFGEDAHPPKLEVLPLQHLPAGDYIKRGYFLIQDVEQYLAYKDAEDLFYDNLSPEVFAARLLMEKDRHSAPVGVVQSSNDDDEYEGDEYESTVPHPVTDYMYFAYPDYASEEYEAFLIREYASAFEYSECLEGAEIVVILDQG